MHSQMIWVLLLFLLVLVAIFAPVDDYVKLIVFVVIAFVLIAFALDGRL